MTLPFVIDTRLAGRGLVAFVASVGDEPVTTERYAPGDGDRRRKVAERWANDDRLRNDAAIDPADVAAALEQAELQALARMDEIEAEGAESVAPSEAAGYADDDIIGELAWNIEAGRPDFIVCDRNGGNISRADELHTPMGTLVVPSICTGIVTPGTPIPGTVLLPTECDLSDEDEARLRRAIAGFVERYVELPDGAVSLVVEYVLLTWMFDAFDETPYLAFATADVGRGKSRALETVGALCYRPMFCGGGSTAAATLRLLDMFAGTLVADEFDQAHNTELAADLTRILNQGFQRGRPLVKCDGESNSPRPFRCFGPKLFALRKGFGDDATASRAISIHMRGRTRADIPLNLPRQCFDAEALAIRNRLLAWRFAAYGHIAIDPILADPQLEDRANQIGLPLLAVARSPEARSRIIAALREQQAGIAVERADSLPGEVFATVLGIAAPGDEVRPGAIAREVNRRRAASEGIDPEKLTGKRRVTPHRVGKMLRQELELPRLGPDRQSARYRLDPARVAELCQRFGVPPSETPQTPHRHTGNATPREIGLFGSASGVRGDGGDGGVSHGQGGVSDDDPGSDRSDDDSDLAFPPPDDDGDDAGPAAPS